MFRRPSNGDTIMSAEDFAKVRKLGVRAREALNEGVDNKHALVKPGSAEERLASLLDEISEFGAESAQISWGTCWRCDSAEVPRTAIAIDVPGGGNKFFKGTCTGCSCIRLGGRS